MRRRGADRAAASSAISARPDRLIRRELCDEAIRLALMLGVDAAGALPETDALVALMCFHAARFDARVDGMGGLLLLEEQDRSRWDGELVQRGLAHLTRSARGQTQRSAYHWVVSAKKPETRAARLAQLIADSASGLKLKHLRR